MVISLLAIVINLVFGFSLFYWPHLFSELDLYFFFLSILTLLVYLYELRYSLLFQIRIIFLASIGFFAGFVKLLDPSFAFSAASINTQTFEIGVQMFALTNVAIAGAYTGFHFSRFQTNSSKIPSVEDEQLWHYLFIISAICVLIIGFFSAQSYGPSVLEASYASQSGGQILGVLQALGVFCITLVFLSYLKVHKKTFLYIGIILSFYLFIWGILIRGGRAEVLAGLLSIAVVCFAANGKVLSLKTWHYLLLLALIVLMEYVGYLRASLFYESYEGFLAGYQRLAQDGVIFAGTVSGIAMTFSNILHMLDSGIIDFGYGSTYLDYFLRTLPGFIDPNRPDDLSQIFDVYGYHTIGGIFELSEAFYNFGIAGCLFVPMFLSFFLGHVYKRAVSGQTIALFVLIGLLSVFFRGAWYQTFAYYRGITIGLLFYSGYLMLYFFTNHLKQQRFVKSVK